MKLRLIYYKDLVDAALKAFISDNEGFFAKSCGKYILGKPITQTKLKSELETYISVVINDLTEAKSDNDKLIIIGSCFPLENMIMQFKDESYFPKKLDYAIHEKPYVKWVLRERDIAIDMSVVNQQLVGIFNDMFTGDSRIYKSLKNGGTAENDIICVAHKRFDSYVMFKIIKWIYGNSNCINVYAEMFGDYKPCLVDVNELVSKYVHRKNEMNKSQEFKKCAFEVKEYLAKKIGV